jgi:RNA polymerase sigma-70 factor (ECF subfamily)
VDVNRESLAEPSIARDAFDFESFFQAQYAHVARIILRVVRDPGPAEDLAVEVFWKLWRNPRAQRTNTRAWIYRTAVRMGLDHLRKQCRREKYESLFRLSRSVPTPEELHFANERDRFVRQTLAAIKKRDAELLVLRSYGLSYEEIAFALGLKLGSIGTLLARAQEEFRKEYMNRYGAY